jgi:hypothetical protein
MLHRDGVVMAEMKVLVMEMMMIPMKSGAMVMTMATISPIREGISSADFCLPESFSLSGVFCPAEAVVSISEPPPPSPSGFFSLLGKSNFLVFFWNFPDLQNMVP